MRTTSPKKRFTAQRTSPSKQKNRFHRKTPILSNVLMIQEFRPNHPANTPMPIKVNQGKSSLPLSFPGRSGLNHADSF
jgi:hypothetical protein